MMTALAASIATALVKTMGSAWWEKTRTAFARGLGRGNPDHSGTIEGQLEESRWLVRNAPPNLALRTAEDVAADWAGVIRALLVENPGMVKDLRGALSEAQSRPTGITQTATATHQATVIQIGRDWTPGA
jgi:hypothetical protein